jgi:membrane protein implicated in regulation of membrane protease activity
MDIFLKEPVYFWLIAMILFIVFELATLGLTTMWFALGALVAMAVAVVGGPVWLQILVFLTIAIVLLALLWPMARKHLKPKLVATNADALIGRVCLVTEAIDPLEGGRVKVGDVTWTARVESDGIIPAGSHVKIMKIQGSKVIVEQVKKEVEV